VSTCKGSNQKYPSILECNRDCNTWPAVGNNNNGTLLVHSLSCRQMALDAAKVAKTSTQLATNCSAAAAISTTCGSWCDLYCSYMDGNSTDYERNSETCSILTPTVFTSNTTINCTSTCKQWPPTSVTVILYIIFCCYTFVDECSQSLYFGRHHKVNNVLRVGHS
jgi:hypothetical protein